MDALLRLESEGVKPSFRERLTQPAGRSCNAEHRIPIQLAIYRHLPLLLPSTYSHLCVTSGQGSWPIIGAVRAVVVTGMEDGVPVEEMLPVLQGTSARSWAKFFCSGLPKGGMFSTPAGGPFNLTPLWL